MMPLSSEGPQILLASGSSYPRWAPDGRSVYVSQGDAILKIAIPPGDHPEPGSPVTLFRLPGRRYLAEPDAGSKGFYSVLDAGDSGIVRELQLVTNWFSELEALTAPEKPR